ncbi:MAG: hypothetical protein JWN52_7196 [Actinomycetia bacterium]|nr:hypothetical protein [Actinomycetes bacterium]
MEFAALVAWVLAGIAGLYLLMVWLANEGLKQQATKVTRFPAIIVLGHPLLAVVGLIVWIMYLMTTSVVYAWSAFGTLVVVALLGFVMLTRWLVGRGGRHARGAEQAFPAVAVAVHGTVAIATFILVFLTALAIRKV